MKNKQYVILIYLFYIATSASITHAARSRRKAKAAQLTASRAILPSVNQTSLSNELPNQAFSIPSPINFFGASLEKLQQTENAKKKRLMQNESDLSEYGPDFSDPAIQESLQTFKKMHSHLPEKRAQNMWIYSVWGPNQIDNLQKEEDDVAKNKKITKYALTKKGQQQLAKIRELSHLLPADETRALTCFLDSKISPSAPSLQSQPNNECHGSMCKKRASSKCGKCKIVSYCSKECQINSWQDHKIICQSINQEQGLRLEKIEKLKNKQPDQNNNYNQEQHSKHIANNHTPPPTPLPEQNLLEKFDMWKIAEKETELALMLHLHTIKQDPTPATFLANQYFCKHCPIPNFDDPDTKKDINYFLQQSQAHGDNNKQLFSIPELIDRWVNEKFIPDQQIKIKEQREKEELERREQEKQQRQLLEQKKQQQEIEKQENRSAQLVIVMQNLKAESSNRLHLEKFVNLVNQGYQLHGHDRALANQLDELLEKHSLLFRPNNPARAKTIPAADRTLAKPNKKNKSGHGNNITTSTQCRKQGIPKSNQKLAASIIARSRLKQNPKYAQSLSAEAKVCEEDYALFRWGLTNVPLEQPAPEPAQPESIEEEAKNAAQLLATQSYIMRHGGLTITVDPHTKKHHVFNDLRYDAGQIDERYDDGCYRIGNTTFFPSTMKEEDLLERIGRAIEENGIPFTDSKGNTIIVAKLPQNLGDSGLSALHRIHLLVVIQKKNPGTIKTCYRISKKTYDRLCLKAQNN